MALYFYCFMVMLAIASPLLVSGVTQPSKPPFVVLDSLFNEIDDLKMFYPGFTTDAVQNMNAVIKGARGYQSSCRVERQVGGSLNCLIGYWTFAQSSNSLSYETWISPETMRSECDYTVGFRECPILNISSVDLLASKDVRAIVDNDPTTSWAKSITPGRDTEIIIDLRGKYEVAAIALNVETVPLDVTVSLSCDNGPLVDVAKLQQEECDFAVDPACQKFFNMRRNVLTISWEDAIAGDKLHLTLHGVTNSDPYHTNYFIIREITLLAKEVPVLPRPATPPPGMSLMQFLRNYRKRYPVATQ